MKKGIFSLTVVIILSVFAATATFAGMPPNFTMTNNWGDCVTAFIGPADHLHAQASATIMLYDWNEANHQMATLTKPYIAGQPLGWEAATANYNKTGHLGDDIMLSMTASTETKWRLYVKPISDTYFTEVNWHSPIVLSGEGAQLGYNSWSLYLSAEPVPEPSCLLALSGGLIGLVGVIRRRR